MVMPQQMMQMPVPVQYVNADGTPVIAPVATTQGGNPQQSQQSQQQVLHAASCHVRDQNGQPIYYQQDPNMQPQVQYVQSHNAQGQPQMTLRTCSLHVTMAEIKGVLHHSLEVSIIAKLMQVVEIEMVTIMGGGNRDGPQDYGGGYGSYNRGQYRERITAKERSR